MKKYYAILLLMLSVAGVSSGLAANRTLIDKGWQFAEIPEDASPESLEFKNVDLPNDWSICCDFDSIYPSGNDGGYVKTGKGLYRKKMNMSKADLARKRQILLEGVYMNSLLKVNGDSVGMRPYGYSSMIYDLTPYLKEGDNLIEVEVDNSHQKNSRWYCGSGIYRHVWLLDSDNIYVKPWGTFIHTPEVDGKMSKVAVSSEIANETSDGAEIEAEITLTYKGEKVAGKRVGKSLAPNSEGIIEEILEVGNPALWSPDSPALYQAEITLYKDGKVIDRSTETFGIRKMEYSPDGFKLNGEPMVLNGGCVHHDNGVLGARSYDAAEAWKVRQLKNAGFNAVRTSHNPPSPAFLDECDRQGLIVIDEVFDCWREKKNDFDYSVAFDEWWDKDVDNFIRRDRNHPSIFCWSTGNEVIERKKLEVVTTAKKLADRCRLNDPTRPVTSALAAWDSDWEIYDPLAAEHEIVGYNYMIHKHAGDHQRVPERVMWQTESFPRDAFSNWKTVTENPYVIGDFVWTALDYLGESSIGRFYYEGESEGESWHRSQWPWHGSYCGDIDITGWRKPISHYRDALYSDTPTLYMAVLEPDGYYGKIKQTMWGVWPTWESWNWKGWEGKPVEVGVISKYPRVRVLLDGKEVGQADMSKEGNAFRAVFTVPYAPGVLTAEAINADGEVAETFRIATAGEPKSIRLTADRSQLIADGQDLVYVTAELVDADGNVVPDADTEIEFAVAGKGDVIASGSGNMKDTRNYCSPRRQTYKGRAIAVVKAADSKGKVSVSAKAPALKSNRIDLPVR